MYYKPSWATMFQLQTHPHLTSFRRVVHLDDVTAPTDIRKMVRLSSAWAFEAQATTTTCSSVPALVAVRGRRVMPKSGIKRRRRRRRFLSSASQTANITASAAHMALLLVWDRGLNGVKWDIFNTRGRNIVHFTLHRPSLGFPGALLDVFSWIALATVNYLRSIAAYSPEPSSTGDTWSWILK